MSQPFYIVIADMTEYCDCCNHGKRTGPRYYEARLCERYEGIKMRATGRTRRAARRNLVRKLKPEGAIQW